MARTRGRLVWRPGCRGLDQEGFVVPGALPIWTIYRTTDGFGDFMIRKQIIKDGEISQTKIRRYADTLEEAREKIPRGLYRMDRWPTDPAEIVETWL
jgi:hypothetical protein